MMKKTIVAVLVLTCLAGCGKNDSATQKASEPKPAEAQQYQPPTEWTRIDRSALPGPKTQIISVYYRAVPADESIKGVKVEVALQYEDDFKKYDLRSQGYAIVNCQKLVVKDSHDNILNLKQGHKYFEFACGIPPESTDNKIQETNAAAEVQAPQPANTDQSGDEATYKQVKAEASQANARYAAAWRMVPQPLRNSLQQSISYMPKQVDRKCKDFSSRFDPGFSRKTAYLKCSVDHEETLSDGIEDFARAYEKDKSTNFRDYVNDNTILLRQYN